MGEDDLKPAARSVRFADFDEEDRSVTARKPSTLAAKEGPAKQSKPHRTNTTTWMCKFHTLFVTVRPKRLPPVHILSIRPSGQPLFLLSVFLALRPQLHGQPACCSHKPTASHTHTSLLTL